METLYGPWEYSIYRDPFAYDNTPSYRLAGDWLSDRGLVEDWGCGTGWAKRFIKGGPYRGIDGAWSKWADEQVDLREYRSDVPCAMMRHVLEHNYEWRRIAENFTDSWHDRAAVVLFIPPQPEDHDTGDETWPVPDLAVSGPDLFEILGRHGTRFEHTHLDYPPEDPIQWGMEDVILMERG